MANPQRGPRPVPWRAGTHAEWVESGLILACGEGGYCVDDGTIKFGDGTSRWADLPRAAVVVVAEDPVEGAPVTESVEAGEGGGDPQGGENSVDGAGDSPAGSAGDDGDLSHGAVPPGQAKRPATAPPRRR